MKKSGYDNRNLLRKAGYEKKSTDFSVFSGGVQLFRSQPESDQLGAAVSESHAAFLSVSDTSQQLEKRGLLYSSLPVEFGG